MTTQSALNSASGRWDAPDDINWTYWIGAFIQERWWILSILLLALLAGFFHSRTAVPIYQSDALIQFEGNKVRGAVSTLEGLIDEKPAINTEIEIIRSRMVLGETIKDLNLDVVVTPKYLPVIGEWLARGKTGTNFDDAALISLSGYAWGGERLELGQFDVPESDLGRLFLLQAEKNRQFRIKLPGGNWSGPFTSGQSVNLQSRNGPVYIFVRVLDARPGTQFYVVRQPLDAAVSGLMGRITASERGRSTGLMDVRLEGPDPVAAQRTLQGIALNYLRQNVERKSAEADQTLKFLDQQLPEVKKKLDAAESSFNAFRTTNRTLNVTAEGENLLQQSVQVQTALTQLEQRKKELLQRFTAEHPSIQSINDQIAALRKQVAQADGAVGSLPKLEQQMLQLMRDVKVANELYVELLNSAQALRVAKAGTVGNARIIDDASLPRGPIRPNKSRIVFLYMLLGLVLSAALVVLKAVFKPGVKDARLIEQRLGLPVYATVPRADELRGKKGQSTLLSIHDAGNPTVESLRSLRTALQFASLEASNQAMLIAGPAPSVGKSFIAANLAVVMAQAGHTVALIDGDMRRGHLHQFFGRARRENGLSDYLAGSMSLEQVVITDTGVSGLAVVPTGAIPPNPSELLLHPRFEALVKELCGQYDHVIFDAGPLLAVTDAAIIGRLCGTTLLVGRYETTPLRELELAAQRLTQAGINLRGIVFNDVQKHGIYGYGYGYGYQYSYSYRSKSKNEAV